VKEGVVDFYSAQTFSSTICKDVCKIVKFGVVSVCVYLKNSHYVDEM